MWARRGVFMVPFLALVYGLAFQQAIGTGLTAIVFTSLASTLVYSRQRRLDYQVGLILAATTTPGSLIGAYFHPGLKSVAGGWLRPLPRDHLAPNNP